MLQSITFQNTGQQRLSCSGCEERVERLLEKLPGIKQVQAHASDQRINVVFDTTRLAAGRITEQLNQAGYEVRIESADGAAVKSPLRLEFIFDDDCPNVQRARESLRAALGQCGLPAQWAEYRHSDPACPEYARHAGSPAVFINGQDVHPAGAEGGNCRLYPTGGGRGFSGVPSVELLSEALESGRARSAPIGAGGSKCCSTSGHAASHSPPGKASAAHRWGGVAALPALFSGAIIPGVCPACWPVYAGLLSAVGLGFLTRERILLPVMIAALLLALGSLAWKAKRRRGYLPFLLGVIASGLILYGEFYLDNAIVHYGGILLLLASCIWNAWPRPAASACEHCRPADGSVSSHA